jgi:hypothetical protein
MGYYKTFKSRVGASKQFGAQIPLRFGDTTDIFDILRLRRDNLTNKYYCATPVIF